MQPAERKANHEQSRDQCQAPLVLRQRPGGLHQKSPLHRRHLRGILRYAGDGGNHEPHLYTVACDIKEHSDDQTITNVMFILEREAVTTTFEIDGSDEI